MVARRKVVPPVTPRIVQDRPRLRLLRYLLLIGALLLSAWLGYHYGLRTAAVNDAAPVMQADDSAQQIAELEQQRDALQQQVGQLEQRAAQLDQALQTERARSESQQQAQSSTLPAPAPAAAPEPETEPETEPESPRAAEASSRNSLKVENLRITRTASENGFRLGFSVMHDGDSNDRVSGTLWIAVNGFTDGEPRRISLKTLSPQNSPFIKMGFSLQQDIAEELVLPANFRPRNILIEAKPYGDDYTGTTATFAWSPDP
ncbi:MAG: hypothetical protein RQ736_12465 [Thiogranum sp.]|nr:hypothetical protein [Thiogranum sp.]